MDPSLRMVSFVLFPLAMILREIPHIQYVYTDIFKFSRDSGWCCNFHIFASCQLLVSKKKRARACSLTSSFSGNTKYPNNKEIFERNIILRKCVHFKKRKIMETASIGPKDAECSVAIDSWCLIYLSRVYRWQGEKEEQTKELKCHCIVLFRYRWCKG